MPTVPYVHSFSPIENADSQVLVLGTMPGKMSLQTQQYYAHPRNAFWKIAGAILGFDADGAYQLRCSSLAASGVALWDVLKSCTRESSLDADIDRDSIVLNDFATFFASHPQIRRVCFNGAQAEALFRRCYLDSNRKHVQPSIADLVESAAVTIDYLRLPSTSPANAATSFAEKLRAWQIIAPGAPLSEQISTSLRL